MKAPPNAEKSFSALGVLLSGSVATGVAEDLDEFGPEPVRRVHGEEIAIAPAQLRGAIGSEVAIEVPHPARKLSPLPLWALSASLTQHV